LDKPGMKKQDYFNLAIRYDILKYTIHYFMPHKHIYSSVYTRSLIYKLSSDENYHSLYRYPLSKYVETESDVTLLITLNDSNISTAISGIPSNV